MDNQVDQERILLGNPIDPNLTTTFRDTVNIYNLTGLGYHGDMYTWANNQHDHHHIKSRLDRLLATSGWISTFPNYSEYLYS